MKYYDNSLYAVVTSLVVYGCLTCISKQPQYLVHYDRQEKTVVSILIFKVLSNEIIPKITNLVLLLRTVTHQTNSEAVKHLGKARIYSIIDERVSLSCAYC